MDGSGDWSAAYEKAKAFVSQLTLLEKVNLTTGVGYALSCVATSEYELIFAVRWANEACVGNTGSIPRLNFPSLCMQDSPLGIRFGKSICSVLSQ
jgi:beta-glucosidase